MGQIHGFTFDSIVERSSSSSRDKFQSKYQKVVGLDELGIMMVILPFSLFIKYGAKLLSAD